MFFFANYKVAKAIPSQDDPTPAYATLLIQHQKNVFSLSLSLSLSLNLSGGQLDGRNGPRGRREEGMHEGKATWFLTE